ncbi:hypothetical protein KKC60_04620 [Patescibacteria group bacterium]|nr:hypothetical protein [Patescibacteria group bacterium]
MNQEHEQAHQDLKKEITEETDEKLESFALIVKKGFDSMDKRFDEVLGEMNERFSKVDGVIGETKGCFDKIDDELAGIKSRLKNVEKRLDLLSEDVGDIKEEVSDINIKFSQKPDRKNLALLDKRVTALEQKVL